MADLQQLKQKYAPVLTTFEKMAPYGAKLDNVDLDGEKIHIKGEVPSTVVANHIWDEIKKADPSYSDLHHEIKTTGPAEQEYTVKAGDTLSAICLLFYGNANKYPQVAKAMGIDADKLPVGKSIKLPVLS
jgi:nucleoid-associated protein YgaU